MLNILIGIVSGIISSLGMGGGAILILCLSFVFGKEQHIAQGANLIFFIPTAIVSIIINIKNKLIKWKIGIIIAICGAIGAIIGSKISGSLDTKRLKLYFGIFLLFVSLFQIYTLIFKGKITNIFNQKSNNNIN